MSSDGGRFDDPYRQPNFRPRTRRYWVRWLIGGIVLALASLLGSCVGCFVIGNRALEEGSRFATQTIASVGSAWDANLLLERAAPELLESTPPEKVRQFLSFVATRLGPLVSAGEVQNGQWRFFTGARGFSVFTWHFSDCEFERGQARITVQLVKRAGQWQVSSFNVNSDLLMQDPP